MIDTKKYVLITGVSTGIGYELSRQLIQKGYTVFGSVRKIKDADDLCYQFGENFIPLVFDITNHEAIAH
jgi:NADP-dependent 3-hydroxy acid dehydrogenase YdfG